jgi:PTH1 family peptidyl-tRNA hydrolase
VLKAEKALRKKAEQKNLRKSSVKIVVGLGNPGRKYEGTPHNVGFDVVDCLAQRSSHKLRGSLRFKAQTAKAVVGTESVLLVKPQTFMNLSGEAVGAVMRYHKVNPSDVLVLLDDVDLELGRIRVRSSGGSGGHKGLASVIQHLGVEEFVRIRMGVGRGRAEADVVSHVLSQFDSAQSKTVNGMIERAADAVCVVLESGVEMAMNRFNSAVLD